MKNPLESVYHLLGDIRNFLYDKGFLKSYVLSKPVISIGNISFGGTGKTPFLIFLVQELISRNQKVLVISKNYKAKKNITSRIDLDEKEAAHVYGDEPVLLQRYLPNAVVWSGPDKYQTALLAMQSENPDIVVVDDGFSHRRLKRNFDIVLIDAYRLNKVYLRERFSEILRANAIVITKINSVNQQKATEFQKELVSKKYINEKNIFNAVEKIEIEAPKKSKLFVFCGIAQPEAFENQLLELGYEIIEIMKFTDHQKYSHELQNKIIEKYSTLKKANENLCLVTTEKDFVKLTDEKILKELFIAKYQLTMTADQKEALFAQISKNI